MKIVVKPWQMLQICVNWVTITTLSFQEVVKDKKSRQITLLVEINYLCISVRQTQRHNFILKLQINKNQAYSVNL